MFKSCSNETWTFIVVVAFFCLNGTEPFSLNSIEALVSMQEVLKGYPAVFSHIGNKYA